MPIGTTYNPADVMMKNPGSGSTPYLFGGPMPGPARQGSPSSLGTPINTSGFPGPARTGGPTSLQQPRPAPSFTLGPEAIRAIGSGPYDPAYRQNLATYAGSQLSRPSGGFNFNPTDPNTFPGQPTGGGSAPVPGMPNSLLDLALGGQPFSWAPPVTPSQQSLQQPMTLQYWLNQFLQGGNQPRSTLRSQVM